MSEMRAPNYVRCAVTPTVKAVNKAKREVLHLISTPSVDRAGDTVQPGGIQVDNFMRNPVVLVDHDYRAEKIIGKSVSTETSSDGMFSRTEFRDTPLGNDAFNLASEGIGGWSIGFRPIEFDTRKDGKGKFKGFNFTKVELLEYSFVAIPMNQDVVAQCVKGGLVRQENLLKLFTIDPENLPSHTSFAEPSKEAPAVAKAPELVDSDLYEVSRAALRRLERYEQAKEIEKNLREKGIV